MLRIPKAVMKQVLSQLDEAYPLEGCGLMAGDDGLVSRSYPVHNLLASPVAYEMDPQEQLAAMLDLEARGLNLLAIYHSHPSGPETPSGTDVAQAYYPEAVYVIVSLRERTSPVVRAYRILDGRVSEEVLVVA